jgi:hypothetical protein
MRCPAALAASGPLFWLVPLALLALLTRSSLARADHAPPPARPPGGDEVPGGEPDDIPRRSVELSLRGSMATLRCGGAAPAQVTVADPCAALGASRSLGLAALWRVSPRLAFGLAASQARFGWDAGLGLADPGEGAGATARWTTVSLEARGYLHDTGRWDPWVSYRAGLGWLTLPGGSSELRQEGLAMTGAIGVDVWLSARMRLGPEAGVSWEATGSPERCGGGRCLGVGEVVARMPDRSIHAGIGLTIALGDEL